MNDDVNNASTGSAETAIPTTFKDTTTGCIRYAAAQLAQAAALLEDCPREAARVNVELAFAACKAAVSALRAAGEDLNQ